MSDILNSNAIAGFHFVVILLTISYPLLFPLRPHFFTSSKQHVLFWIIAGISTTIALIPSVAFPFDRFEYHKVLIAASLQYPLIVGSIWLFRKINRRDPVSTFLDLDSEGKKIPDSGFNGFMLVLLATIMFSAFLFPNIF